MDTILNPRQTTLDSDSVRTHVLERKVTVERYVYQSESVGTHCWTRLGYIIFLFDETTNVKLIFFSTYMYLLIILFIQSKELICQNLFSYMYTSNCATWLNVVRNAVCSHFYMSLYFTTNCCLLKVLAVSFVLLSSFYIIFSQFPRDVNQAVMVPFCILYGQFSWYFAYLYPCFKNTGYCPMLFFGICPFLHGPPR